MSENSTATGGGIGVAGLLGTAFVIMKLAGIGAVANWSWWWVLSPFWIPAAIIVVILIVAGILYAIASS